MVPPPRYRIPDLPAAGNGARLFFRPHASFLVRFPNSAQHILASYNALVDDMQQCPQDDSLPDLNAQRHELQNDFAKMKILFIINELGYRGTPRFLVHCAFIARKAGHDVAIWALEQGGLAKDECVKMGIPVIEKMSVTRRLSFSPSVFALVWCSRRKKQVSVVLSVRS